MAISPRFKPLWAAAHPFLIMQIDILGVGIDFGAGARGVNMGPSAIRLAGLHEGLEALGHTLNDLGDLAVPIRQNTHVGDPRLRYLDPILDVTQRLSKHVEASISSGSVPLVLGGDHSLSAGSISGAARVMNTGVIWIDTHGDFNTAETSPSGNIHGMPLAALCGLGDPRLVSLGGLDPVAPKINPANVVIVGAREIDPEERVLMREAGVTVYSMAVIDRFGMRSVMERAIEIASRGTQGVWMSLDLDAVDPMYAPGVGTPAPGGLTVREAHLAVEMIAASGRMIGMDLVEVNPILDRENMTGTLAVDLALSAFGKTVWDREDSLAGFLG